MIDYTAMHAPEAEQSVLGALLLVADSFDRIGDLDESDFFAAQHRSIFRRIAFMHANRMPVDVVTVSEALQSVGELESVGGFAYLAELAAGVVGASNIKRYAEMVAEKRMLRDLLAASVEITEIATAQTGQSAADRIDTAQAKLFSLSEAKAGRTEAVEIGSLLPDFITELERRVECGGGITGLATGFDDMDRITKGFQPGDLIIIAGRPSMGKTAFAVNVAEHVALNDGVALVFSMEMPAKQLTERVVSSIGMIDNDRLRTGSLNDEEYQRLTFALSRIDKSGLLIDDSPALSVAQMSGRSRRLKRLKGRLDLIVIDYLQLMGGSTSGKNQNRNEELGAITRGLKLLARELSVPVVALSQLSRKVEERADKRPMLSDLRESGAIEQDADLVLMAYRDDYYDANSPFKGLAEMLIRKHRMGSVGDVRLVFQGQFSKFQNADHQAVAAACAAASATRSPAKRRGFDG